ncbi:PAS domain-containing hybrid sensor histidine kinase/response regulator [Desulfovibrio sp. JC010]|uniref:PAS domain-containing sensor histidine kinase n=1 Tax=Desulfovibrio sp. JC010 TaxID=2593641 RepID=UPI0013D40218|nr:PAS domain-containing hybrid sensor histidine kinase/response regulator [Desulfovibrio sp. JC010]
MLNKKLPGFFKEQITAKVIFLCLIFLAGFAVNYTVDRVQLNTLARYDRAIHNQQARSELGKAVMHRLLMIELGVARMVDSTDLRKVDLLMGDINHSLDKLVTALNVLQHGGTFKNTFPANFYETDEVREQIDFYRDADAGYAMEVIDLNPKVFELEEVITSVSFTMRKLLIGDELPTLERVHSALNFRTMQIDALILRARESAGKIFHETQIEIKQLKELRQNASDRMDNLRLGVLIFTLPVCLFIFFRILFNIRSILADRENKARNLEEAKLAIETILDSIPVGMAIVNSKREIIRVNSEALKIFDVDSMEMILGERCNKVFCLSSSEGCPFGRGIAGNYVNEVKIETATGREITVLKNATYISLSGERVILEAFMDISDRIEMEKRLQEQQDYTNAVLQGVQAGVVVIAAESHTIVDMNETAARLIGVNREEALGAICHKYICPAEVGKCPVTDLGQEIDHAVRRLSNGKSVLKSVVPFKRGDKTYLLENFVDITDRINAEEKLKTALKNADSASRAKSEFLSRMSHELRTPLNAIVGFSDILLTEKDDPLAGKMRSQVEHIREAGHHLLQMITEVLDFSMIESGNFSISLESVPAAGLITESVKLVEQAAVDSGIMINVHEDVHSLPELKVDRTRFKQVLINLLSNGIKFNYEGGSVDISGTHSGGRVVLTVADTGIGIPAGRQGELFKPFSRLVDNDSGIEGAGIGLAISRQLIEAMDGSIDVSSGQGEGTVFTLYVPAAGAGKEDSSLAAAEDSEAVNLPTLLYVEDHAGSIEELRKIVSDWNKCALIVRKTVEKGLRALPLLKPDAVLLSGELAGDELGQIVAEIRSLGSDEWMPYIAVLGSGDAQGADRVMPLPVTLDGLQRIVMESKEEK